MTIQRQIPGSRPGWQQILIMKQRLLITGISGFVGKHLVNQLEQDQAYEVFGTALQAETIPGVHIFAGDLKDPLFVKKLVGEVSPEFVIHLAAQSSVAYSIDNPRQTLEDNFLLELNLLDALKDRNNLEKILVISSADVYGNVKPEDLPIDENQPLAPNSPYGVSKILQEDVGRGYFLTHRLPIVILRPFGHIGPDQPPKTAIASFVEKIRQAKDGETIAVGNLKVKRDFCDVRDIVKAYRLALDKATIGETYNLGAGKSYLLADLLSTLIKTSGKTLQITIDKTLLRPHDIMETRCNYSKFTKATGWEPTIPIEQTLKDIWEDKGKG